jgi:hypothetical protein
MNRDNIRGAFGFEEGETETLDKKVTDCAEIVFELQD